MTPDVLARLRAALTATPAPPPLDGATAAAVLVPLFERDGDLELLFTTRSAGLPSHAGEVSFPGGRHARDADATLLATALRETEEEIGVAARDVDVLGALDPIRTRMSNFVIMPFVGRIPYPYRFRLRPGEVDDVFSVPLVVLAAADALVEETWTIQGHAVPIVSYRHGGRTIWGVTQRITATLVDLLTALASQQD